jgi:uncharacterized protein YjbI with pentapeptide repeats
MASAEHLVLLRTGVDSWNKWRKDNSSEKIDLEGADLQKADLVGIDFSHANLEMANLSGAKLGRANLSSARLKKANLSHARLDHANFTHSHLTKANLAFAHLENAVLLFADLRGTDLRGAFLKRASLEDANLRNANLAHAHLEKAVLAYADCTKAEFIGATLDGANLTAAKLEGTNVSSVKFDQGILWNLLKETHLNPTKMWKRRDDFILDTTLRCKGVYAACYGSQRFASFLKGQDFLEETMETRKGRISCFIWWVLADCGRSLSRWALWTCVIVLLFAALFCLMGEQGFSFSALKFGFDSMLYYSIITFSTLGNGDIIPQTPLGALLTALEVLFGYFMLGGLVSIFATKIVRAAK